MFTVFTDFDGVMHPEGLGEAERDKLFCCLPAFHRILRAAPGVNVVFSTSWRLLYSHDELVAFAIQNGGEDLTPRFIGLTPHLPARERPQGIIGQREDEIQAWLAANGQDSMHWLALDDQADLFRPGCSSLYLVDWQTGLVDEDVWAIVESLRF